MHRYVRQPVLPPHPARVPVGDRGRVRRARPHRAVRRTIRVLAASRRRRRRRRRSSSTRWPRRSRCSRRKAKAVIFLFMYGGPSQVDTFDEKPELAKLDGKTITVKTFGRGGHKNEGRVVGPKFAFKNYGQCGKRVSTSSRTSARAWTTSRSSTPCTPSRRSTARACS